MQYSQVDQQHSLELYSSKIMRHYMQCISQGKKAEAMSL